MKYCVASLSYSIVSSTLQVKSHYGIIIKVLSYLLVTILLHGVAVYSVLISTQVAELGRGRSEDLRNHFILENKGSVGIVKGFSENQNAFTYENIFFFFFKLFKLIYLNSFRNLEHLLFIFQILPGLLSDPNKETLLPHQN